MSLASLLVPLLTALLAQDPAPATRPATEPSSFPPGHATFDAQAETAVPIKFGPHGLPMIAAPLNGVDVPIWVLDTGAGAMVIVPSAVEKAGLKESEGVDVNGMGDAGNRPTATGGSLRVGPVTLDDCRWLVLKELDGPFALLAFGEPVSGIIGRDLFVSSVVDLDWANERIVIYPADKPPVLPAGVEWLPLEFVNDLPSVRCTFADGKEGLFMIDTGHDGGVSFESEAVKKHNLLDGKETGGGGLLGIGGKQASVKGTVDGFTLAGVSHDGLPASFATEPRPNAPARDGLIGMELLRRYRIVLDMPHSRAAFIPLDAAGR